MKGYGHKLWLKPRLLVLNKMDALQDDQRQAAMVEVSAMNLPVYAISAVSGEGIASLLREIYSQVLDMREQSRIENKNSALIAEGYGLDDAKEQLEESDDSIEN